MATVTDRLRRPTLLPGIIAGLLFCLLCAGSAAHAATLQRHHDGVQRARSHGNAQAQAGTLAQTTGLTASQVTAAAVCPAARPGHARCAADALVLRSDRRLVRPRVRGRASFTQVFPRVAHGIVPEAATANSIGAAAPQAGTPAYLQQAYDLGYLSQTAGTGDTVAIVDAYDDPGAASNLATYRSTFGLPACTTANGCFTKVNEHGATSPLPAGNTGWEMEESLDMDAVSSLCPNCHILLVEANSASFSDLDTAVITAAAMGAKQISNSWAGGAVGPIGGSFSFPGVAVIAATGDGGYDGPGWDAYPAALPGVTAAGGTTLTASGSSAARARGFTESAWSLSGGEGGGSGCDVYEAKPSYQTDHGCNGRSYSDVSADANPSTGMIVYDAGNGGWLQVGGTSLATPLIAAFDAVTGVSGGAAQWAYSDAALLNDPATGSNGSCATQIAYICNAGTGYDGPTGAGSISGDIVTGAPGIGGPSVGTGSGNTYTQSVTTTAATLAGGVYPNGLATTYWWQYGTTTGYGQQTPAVSIGSGRTAVAVTSALSGLIANTTYHYRLVAQNSDGTSYGYDSTLATKASAPVNSAAPVISGTAREGQMLSATAGSWSAAGTLTYQWRRSVNGGSTWTAVTGAVTTVDNLGVADAGALIDVVVTDTTSSGATSATSAAAGPVQSDAPVATAAPPISGTARQGDALTTTGGGWNPTGTLGYQWKRSVNGGSTWTAIAGATGASYTQAAADVGARLEVTVTATNAYGAASATSPVAGPVLSGAPALLTAPVITGTAKTGQVLSSTGGSWNPTGTLTYQWKRSTNNGSTWTAISGATKASYTQTTTDVGAKLELTVTATNAYGTASATAAPTGTIANAAKAAAPAVVRRRRRR
jgi:hypothetical protein